MNGILGRDELSTVQVLQPSSLQREGLGRIVQQDVDSLADIRFADGGDDFSHAVAIFVRRGFNGLAPDNLLHGLPPIPAYDGTPFSEVGEALAVALASLLRSDALGSLHVPLPLAVPSEIDKLSQKFGGHVYELNGRLFVRFSGTQIESELIRRGLVGMLGAYSVAWLVAGSDIHSRPIAALVSIFDGEGWGVLGDYESVVSSSV